MIIGLCGYAQVGKDTAAAGLENFTRLAFADALKREVQTMLVEAGMPVDLTDDAAKVEWRPLLVLWGRKRREQDPAYWIKRLIVRAAFLKLSLRGDDIVLTDVRYLNEAQWVVDHGGRGVYIDRPGFGPANEEEGRSIPEVLNSGLPISVLSNDGTVHQLRQALREIIG